MLLRVPLSLAVLAAGCDTLLGLEREGTFSARVAGAVNESLRGRAVLDDFGFGIGEGYGITLSAPSGHRIFLTSRDKPRPGVYEIRRFQVGSPEGAYQAAFLLQPNGGTIYDSLGGGSIEISSVGGELHGTFRFEAVNWPGEPTVAVDGSFVLR